MTPKVKKLAIMVYGALALLIVIFAVGAYWSGKQNAELIDTGIHTTATVTDMSSSKASKRSSPVYTISVNYFSDTTRKEPTPASNSAPKAQTPEELKAQAFKTLEKNSASISAGLGDYQKASVAVSVHVYQSLNIGDKVKIVFDPKEPERILLLGKVE
ncbi:MAG: hypothetical protein EAZ92_11175 [Candidatus Kapaibacterium sp.]|nr:MAG: hypothetical protein EAZ92_11175 [Candidatus Kapabacteria bacterium]